MSPHIRAVAGWQAATGFERTGGVLTKADGSVGHIYSGTIRLRFEAGGVRVRWVLYSGQPIVTGF